MADCNPSWFNKIESEVRSMGDREAESARWSKRSIYRIPASVTELKKRVYKPQIVSFGPYHNGEDHLKGMEEHKRRALLHFLKRSDKSIDDFIGVLTPVVQDLKEAYDQLEPKWEDDAFLEMMIVDGCFILELLRATTTSPDQLQVHVDTQPQTVVADEDYASNDPIFSKHGKFHIVPYFRRDMLMLENQIPMQVLEKLVSIQNDDCFKNKELTRRILQFFSQPESPRCLQKIGQCLHILDVYRKSLLIDGPRAMKSLPKGVDDSQIYQGSDEIIRSATELNEAGITIVKNKTRSLKDISFHGGVLRLPLIVVDDSLESLYLNMIAYERFHVGAGNDITSYIFFMDNIIDNSRDVSLLHSCGIIQNALGSDKAVANLFNTLSSDVTLEPHSSLDYVHKQVSAYCQQPWHRWRANLMHTYFTNPWAILSVIAAILLFALTIIQTVYSVLSYIDPTS